MFRILHGLKLSKAVVQNVYRIDTTALKRNLGSSLGYVGQTVKERKVVGYWLMGCAGLVYGAVAIGGVTRLTESGLSMVNWDLFRTMKPPLNQKEWETEFENYKMYPEYKFKTSNEEMTLGQFKFIWTMEYMHRMWGRLIGVAFLLPCAYFWACGRFSRPMKVRMGLAGALIVAQGLVGWWMVKSGLNPENNSNSDVPRVSQYRLTTHLTMAFALYAMFLWTGFSHILQPFDHTVLSGIKRLRGMTHGTKTLVFLTAIMGGFVAGLDAGLVYNSWPKFADQWIPSELMSRSPKWKNFFENEVTVQFMHRSLAYLTLLSVTMTWIVGRKLKLSPRAKIALHSLLVLAYGQAVLGISTLVYYVPVWLAALHQNGSLALITAVMWLSNEIRRIPK